MDDAKLPRGIQDDLDRVFSPEQMLQVLMQLKNRGRMNNTRISLKMEGIAINDMPIMSVADVHAHIGMELRRQITEAAQK